MVIETRDVDGEFLLNMATSLLVLEEQSSGPDHVHFALWSWISSLSPWNLGLKGPQNSSQGARAVAQR